MTSAPPPEPRLISPPGSLSLLAVGYARRLASLAPPGGRRPRISARLPGRSDPRTSRSGSPPASPSAATPTSPGSSPGCARPASTTSRRTSPGRPSSRAPDAMTGAAWTAGWPRRAGAGWGSSPCLATRPPGRPRPGTSPRSAAAAGSPSFSAFVRSLVERYGTGGGFWAENPGCRPGRSATTTSGTSPTCRVSGARDFPDPADTRACSGPWSRAARPADPRARFLLEADTRVLATGHPGKPFLAAMLRAVPNLDAYAYAVSVHPYQGDGESPRECSRPKQ